MSLPASHESSPSTALAARESLGACTRHTTGQFWARSSRTGVARGGGGDENFDFAESGMLACGWCPGLMGKLSDLLEPTGSLPTTDFGSEAASGMGRRRRTRACGSGRGVRTSRTARGCVTGTAQAADTLSRDDSGRPGHLLHPVAGALESRVCVGIGGFPSQRIGSKVRGIARLTYAKCHWRHGAASELHLARHQPRAPAPQILCVNRLVPREPRSAEMGIVGKPRAVSTAL